MTITTIYTQRKELSTRPLSPDILNWNVLLSVLIQMQIFILARHVFQWKDVIIQVWRLSTISKYNVREPSLQCIIQKSVCPRFKFGYLNLVCLEKNVFSVNIVQRRISEAQTWQTIGMRPIGISFKAIGCQMGYYYTIVSRLVRQHIQTNIAEVAKIRKTVCNVAAWRQALHRLVIRIRIPFATNPVLKRQWLTIRRLSARIVGNRW